MNNVLKTTSKGFFTAKLLLLFYGLFFISCGQSDSDRFDTYGMAITSGGASDLNAVIDQLGQGDTTEVKVVAEIDQVCQVKGCWMTLKSGSGETIRVTFKDYGFFVPTDAGDKKVILTGLATVKELDEKTARHYAEDAGEEFDESSNRKEVAIVASGVLIEKGAGTR